MKANEKQIEKQKQIKYFIFSLVVLVVAAIITTITINKTGSYPWGENTYKYMFTKDISFAFNSFVVFVFIFGGMGILLWGYYFKRQKLCLFLAIIWFFVPNNLRVLFSEGNIPLVVINAIIPYLILVYYKAISEDKNINYFLLALVVAIMTLFNATITIMLLILLCLFNLFTALTKKVSIKSFFILSVLTLVIFILRYTVTSEIQSWVLPKSVELLVYPLKDSLNPFFRFDNIQIYYIGLSFFIATILGIIFCNNVNKEKILFSLALMMFLCTSSTLVTFIEKLPISEFLTLSRIISLAIAMILFAIVRWESFNKLILLVMCFFISLDCMMSFELLGFNRDLPHELITALDKASEMAIQKIGILDVSEYGSFPNYYLSYEKGFHEDRQMQGFNWMNSEEKDEIITINTALENNYFSVVFSRSLDLGADTLIVKKTFIKSIDDIEYWAKEVGYERKYEDENVLIYKYDIDKAFEAEVTYDGITIGKYGDNIIYNFPNFTSGESDYIDDYDIEELMSYKSIFLSGFKYNDKEKAESMIKELSESGVRVVIDINGINNDGILGVNSNHIDFIDKYGQVYYKGREIALDNFPEELNTFRCYYIENITADDSNYAIADSMLLNYIHYKNDNLIFVGLNLPYYAFLTKDKDAILILEDILGVEANKLLEIEVIKGERNK